MLRTVFQPARRAFIGLVSILALGLAAPAAAEPALWAIRDQDSTIYLFGTIHVLKPETQWRSPRINQALKASDDLVIEVLGADDPAIMQPLVMQYGLDRATPLSQKLSPKDLKRAQGLAQGGELGVDLVQRGRAVLGRVAFAEHVQVDAVQDKDVHGGTLSLKESWRLGAWTAIVGDLRQYPRRCLKAIHDHFEN